MQVCANDSLEAEPEKDDRDKGQNMFVKLTKTKPQLRGQVNALGWEREDEHHQKNVLGLAQDARQTTFSNENNYNDYNNYQGGKGWKRKYHWGKGENEPNYKRNNNLSWRRKGGKGGKSGKANNYQNRQARLELPGTWHTCQGKPTHSKRECPEWAKKQCSRAYCHTWPTNHTSTISAEWERKNKPTLLKPKLRINNADTTTPTT